MVEKEPNREPNRPGEILDKELLKPLRGTQKQLADDPEFWLTGQ